MADSLLGIRTIYRLKSNRTGVSIDYGEHSRNQKTEVSDLLSELAGLGTRCSVEKTGGIGQAFRETEILRDIFSFFTKYFCHLPGMTSLIERLFDSVFVNPAEPKVDLDLGVFILPGLVSPRQTNTDQRKIDSLMKKLKTPGLSTFRFLNKSSRIREFKENWAVGFKKGIEPIPNRIPKIDKANFDIVLLKKERFEILTRALESAFKLKEEELRTRNLADELQRSTERNVELELDVFAKSKRLSNLEKQFKKLQTSHQEISDKSTFNRSLLVKTLAKFKISSDKTIEELKSLLQEIPSCEKAFEEISQATDEIRAFLRIEEEQTTPQSSNRRKAIFFKKSDRHKFPQSVSFRSTLNLKGIGNDRTVLSPDNKRQRVVSKVPSISEIVEHSQKNPKKDHQEFLVFTLDSAIGRQYESVGRIKRITEFLCQRLEKESTDFIPRKSLSEQSSIIS